MAFSGSLIQTKQETKIMLIVVVFVRFSVTELDNEKCSCRQSLPVTRAMMRSQSVGKKIKTTRMVGCALGWDSQPRKYYTSHINAQGIECGLPSP